MKKTGLIIVSSALVLGVAFLGFKQYDQHRFNPVDLANGESKYGEHCLSCHGNHGHGDGVVAASLSVKPDSIYEEITNPLGLKWELINSIRDGDNGQGGVMPAFKDQLTQKDVNDILEYVRHVNRENQSS